MGKTADNYADWRLGESLREYNFYFNQLKRMLLSMFEWSGKDLPKRSSRFIENSLFQTGLIIFYKSEKTQLFQFAKATPIGLNTYEEPIGFRTYSFDTSGKSTSEYVKATDCVPIYNDFFHMGGNIENVNYYAKRLSNFEKTIDINLEKLKLPDVYTCPEGQVQSLKTYFAKASNGIPIVIANDDFTRNVSVQKFANENANYISDLNEVKRSILSDALTFFGVNNVLVNKKERLIKDEANQNNEEIALNKNFMFRARNEAVEEIQEKFQLEINVELSENIILPEIMNKDEVRENE